MSPWLIIFVGCVYAYIGFEQGTRGNLAMAIVFAGYAFSNIGLYRNNIKHFIKKMGDKKFSEWQKGERPTKNTLF